MFERRLQELKLGIQVHDPRYGAWWPKATHLSKAAEYNKKWFEFLNVPEGRTLAEVLEFARRVAGEYGLTVYF